MSRDGLINDNTPKHYAFVFTFSDPLAAVCEAADFLLFFGATTLRSTELSLEDDDSSSPSDVSSSDVSGASTFCTMGFCKRSHDMTTPRSR